MIKAFPLFAALAAIAVWLTPAMSLAAEGKDKAGPNGGEKIQCVPLYMINQTRVLDDKTILFEMKNGDVWRNELPFACHGLKREDRFSYKTSTGQLCSMDIITVLPTMGIPGPTCGLGEFVRGTPETGKNHTKEQKK